MRDRATCFKVGPGRGRGVVERRPSRLATPPASRSPVVQRSTRPRTRLVCFALTEACTITAHSSDLSSEGAAESAHAPTCAASRRRRRGMDPRIGNSRPRVARRLRSPRWATLACSRLHGDDEARRSKIPALVERCASDARATEREPTSRLRFACHRNSAVHFVTGGHDVGNTTALHSTRNDDRLASRRGHARRREVDTGNGDRACPRVRALPVGRAMRLGNNRPTTRGTGIRPRPIRDRECLLSAHGQWWNPVEAIGPATRLGRLSTTSCPLPGPTFETGRTIPHTAGPGDQEGTGNGSLCAFHCVAGAKERSEEREGDRASLSQREARRGSQESSRREHR